MCAARIGSAPVTAVMRVITGLIGTATSGAGREFAQRWCARRRPVTAREIECGKQDDTRHARARPARPGVSSTPAGPSRVALLNGVWEFSFDLDATCRTPADSPGIARLPCRFLPENPRQRPRSGSVLPRLWYRRRVPVPAVPPGGHAFLHFGAVDYEATVFWTADGCLTSRRLHAVRGRPDPGGHRCGRPYGGGVVRACDDPHDLAKPRGKQDWHLEPHSIWYPRTTGIWQTVWLEVVSATGSGTCAGRRTWNAGKSHGRSDRRASRSRAQPRSPTRVRRVDGRGDRYSVVGGEVHRRIALSDPGIDDYGTRCCGARVANLDRRDPPAVARRRAPDRVASYTALRTIGCSVTASSSTTVLSASTGAGPGYWVGTAALRQTTTRSGGRGLAKAMGFNGVRKHQRSRTRATCIGPTCWVCWSGRMPSAYTLHPGLGGARHGGMDRGAPARLQPPVHHRCWCRSTSRGGCRTCRHCRRAALVQALYHLTRTLDSTRPVIGNDGWESVATDIIGIHDYDDDPRRLAGATERMTSCPGCFAGNGRAGVCWSSTATGRATNRRSSCREFGASPSAASRARGAIRGRPTPRSSPPDTSACSRRCTRSGS